MADRKREAFVYPELTLQTVLEDTATNEGKSKLLTDYTTLVRASIYPFLEVRMPTMNSKAFESDSCPTAATSCQKKLLQDRPAQEALLHFSH